MPMYECSYKAYRPQMNGIATKTPSNSQPSQYQKYRNSPTQVANSARERPHIFIYSGIMGLPCEFLVLLMKIDSIKASNIIF